MRRATPDNPTLSKYQAGPGGPMPQVIVSYDGTRNDRDALALGRLFAQTGAKISLAYVRHATEPDPQREAAAQQEAEHLLAVGAGLLDIPGVGQYVIVNSSTAEGLAALAAELGADVIAFGSSSPWPRESATDSRAAP
jgi:nucleotide-binding universal stress UspA family protein